MIGRVIDIFKLIITNEDVFERKDYYILDDIESFALSEEASHISAAKQLLVYIGQAVRLLLRKLTRANQISAGENDNSQSQSNNTTLAYTNSI